MLSEQGGERRAFNSPFVLMSAFEEFVSRTLCIHFHGGEEKKEKKKKEISLPEAHHAASLVMQRITSEERSTKN